MQPLFKFWSAVEHPQHFIEHQRVKILVCVCVCVCVYIYGDTDKDSNHNLGDELVLLLVIINSGNMVKAD